MKKSSLQIVGWVGALLIIGAYCAVSFDVLPATGVIYQVMNIAGSLGVVIEASSKKDWQPTFLNMVWILIALVAIVRLYFI
jgi:hypothetical protein